MSGVVSRSLAVLSSTALLVALPLTALPATFNATSDAQTTAKCFATYQTLSHAAFGLKLVADSNAYQVQSYRGTKRMHPYVEAISKVLGSEAFYRQSVLSRIVESRALDALDAVPVDSARDALARSLSVDATKCDRQLDAWGAAPFLGQPEGQ